MIMNLYIYIYIYIYVYIYIETHLNSPSLRTHLTRILAKCWRRSHFPAIWKRATVSLIHKKGPLDAPGNFRSIALQPVLGKILNSAIRNRLHKFLTSNNLMNMRMQKGFWPGVDGVPEHIAHLK